MYFLLFPATLNAQENKFKVADCKSSSWQNISRKPWYYLIEKIYLKER